MYGKLNEFEQFPDEKWNTERKLRNTANDTVFFMAQAVGSALPDAAEYDCLGWKSTSFGKIQG